jgi:hypothetical protein
VIAERDHQRAPLVQEIVEGNLMPGGVAERQA